MVWIIAYGRFSSGKLAVLNAMKFFKCEHLLPLRHFSQVRCHCSFTGTFCLLGALARSRNIGFPRINVCETWQTHVVVYHLSCERCVFACVSKRERRWRRKTKYNNTPTFPPPPPPLQTHDQTSRLVLEGSALRHLNVRIWQADPRGFLSPPAVNLFPWYFAEKTVFSKMVQGSAVTRYEEGAMFSGCTVTSVSTLTTELAQTHFQTTRSLWQSLTKALVPSVPPGPDHLCANDPVVLPVSVRPVSTRGLRAVGTNLSSWGGQLCAVCFSFKVSKRNVLELTATAPLFYGALPCSPRVLPVQEEQAESHGGTLWSPKHLLV